MRYIRINDGIVSFAKCEEMTINGLNGLYFSKNGHNSFVQLEDIIKQADTIEELCDEFVCLENKMTFHDLEIITSSCNLKHLTVYGAIWTDKGLIYVAKMNDKGELELL